MSTGLGNAPGRRGKRCSGGIFMIKLLLDRRLERLLIVGLALIPACMGLFAFLNNASGWGETVKRMVYPMVSMNGTFGNPAQTWRAIDSMLFADAVYLIVFCIEGIFGLIGFLGIGLMIRSLGAPQDQFLAGVNLVKVACLMGVFVYGFLFFTIGGDWFLAWQNQDLRALQQDAVNYGVIVTMAYLLIDRQTAATR